jgi:PAS domain S-box-containing protein
MKKEFSVQKGASVIKHNLQPLLRSILIALIYLISFILLDFIAKQFESVPGIVTWYPPAGLTYALLLVFGLRFTPAVILTLFFSSVFIYRMPQPPYQLLLWACVVSLVYAAGAWFLRHRILLDLQLQKLRDVAWLIGTTVLVSAFLAVLSVSSSALSSALPRSEVLGAIFHWWIGETVGVLTVTPFLLIFVMPRLKRFVGVKPELYSSAHSSFPFSAISAIGQAVILFIILYWVFGLHILGDYHPEFMIILPVIWIALTRGLKGTTMAILILNFGVVLAQWYFRFDLMRLGEVELLMIVICILGLLMGAIVTERKSADDASRESEEQYRTLVEEVNDGFYISDAAGVFTFANSSLARIYGVENSQALLGCKFMDIVSPDMPAGLNDAYSRAMQDGHSSEVIEGQIMKPDGTRTFIEIKPVMILEAGQIVGTRGVVRDITERKQAELVKQESEERYRDLVENSQELICTHDLEGRILSTNPAGAKMLGLEMEAVLKLTIRDIIAPERKADFENYIASIKNNGKSSGLMLVQTSSGERRLWEYNNTLRKEGVAAPIVRGMARDITASKRAEEEINSQLDELQRWHAATLGREKRILELKHEVNELLAETKQLPRYPSAESQDEQE